MGLMARDASFSKSLVLEGERTDLLSVALCAGFVQPSHRKALGWLKDIASVRVVALHTIYIIFSHRMMVWQIEFSLDIKVALETG